jgi:hypothetical protein
VIVTSGVDLSMGAITVVVIGGTLVGSDEGFYLLGGVIDGLVMEAVTA